MEPLHTRERKALDEAIGKRGERAFAPFLGGQKDEAQRSVEAARFAEQLGRAEQHRRVAIVPAGVHDSAALRFVFAVAALFDAQRVHIGSLRDRPGATAATRTCDGACSAHALNDFVEPKLLELCGDERRRPQRFEAEFRMAMQFAPSTCHLALQGFKVGHATSSFPRRRNAIKYRRPRVGAGELRVYFAFSAATTSSSIFLASPNSIRLFSL